MRIVYVLTSLGVGGAERQALAVADRMVRRGHEVALVVLKPRLAEEWPTDLCVIHLDMRKTALSGLRGLLKARSFLLDFKPDLLHSHSFHANIVARLLKVFVPSGKVISTIHNVYEGGWRRMMAYRLTDGLSSQTTAVSQVAADRFVWLKAVPQRKCVALLNGIDTEEFTPSADRRSRTREEMAAGSSFIWLAVGRLVAAKDYPNMLRAFGQVREAFPDAQLWIAGAPADGLQKRTEDGRSGFVFGFAAERGSMERVRLLGLRRDMPALFDAADGFVSSSAWEGMPLAVGEAMAMEKTVVATDAGGTRELVGDAGSIVQAGDSNALAAAMLDLMRWPAETRQNHGRAARVRIVRHFSMDARADAWEALYRNVVEAAP
jgi:glycosyltransferase involved in cell wall biosynthesis